MFQSSTCLLTTCCFVFDTHKVIVRFKSLKTILYISVKVTLQIRPRLRAFVNDCPSYVGVYFTVSLKYAGRSSVIYITCFIYNYD